MPSPLQQQLIQQLTGVIAELQRVHSTFYRRTGDWSFGMDSSLAGNEIAAVVIEAGAMLARIAGRDSEFFRPYAATTANGANVQEHSAVEATLSSLQALRRAIESGWLTSLETQLRANVHNDFMLQGEELLANGYHVAAIVLIGGVLEDHLRGLCVARSLAWTGNGNINTYNTLLYRTNLYPVHVMRRIQAVADLRNQAAHGNGASVAAPAVSDERTFVVRFLGDYPS